MANGNEFTGFGYWRGCPINCKLAWGARTILNRDGNIDILYDRTDWNGINKHSLEMKTELANRINLAMSEIRENVKQLVRSGEMRGDTEWEFTLFDEEMLKVIGNTNGSHGYLYLVAFSPE